MTRSSGTDRLTSEAILPLLHTTTLGRSLHVLGEVASTNREALACVQSGERSGTVIVAESQTAGRGRRGRSWHSPAAGNLYCSIIFAPPSPAQGVTPILPWIPLVAGVAAVTAIRELTGLHAALKWPNDLLLHKKKCGGILCESTQQDHGQVFTIIGVGLNANSDPASFPEDLSATSTSLRAESGLLIDRASLLARLLDRLEEHLACLSSGRPGQWREMYVPHCATIGQRVRVEGADGECVEGLARGIGEDGSLTIQIGEPHREDGSPHLIDVRAGDVIHLRPAQ